MKILLLYATISGNSAMLCDQLKDKLSAAHADKEFEVKDADNCKGQNFAEYDLIIFASSTWDEGHMNLVAEDFMDQLAGVEGRKFALVGLGDSSYPIYCTGVDQIADKLKQLGATVVGSVHKIDGFIDDEKTAEAVAWAETVLV